MKKRMIALLLCLCMTLTLLPVQAFASEGGEEEEPQPQMRPTLLNEIYLSNQPDGPLALTTSLEVHRYYDTDGSYKFPNQFSFIYPAKPGEKGILRVEAIQDTTITVKRGSTESSKESRSYTYEWNNFSLDEDVITITATNGEKTEVYTITLTPDAEVPTFNKSPITGEGFTLTPAFISNQREYVLTVPAEAKTLVFDVDPNLGVDYSGRQFWVYPRNSKGDYLETYYDDVNYEVYWDESNDVMPVPLENNAGEKATELLVTVGDKFLRQDYRFKIERAEPGQAELPSSFFDSNYTCSYDGNSHSRDLLKISPLLIASKLTFTFDDTRTTALEKLSAVTEAGHYNVFVSYEGDSIYAPVEDKQLFDSYGNLMTVCLNPATLTVDNKLTNNKELTLPYFPFNVCSGVTIPGLTVKGLDGSTVNGTWTVSWRTELPDDFNAEAHFDFKEESMRQNYYVPDVPVYLTLENRVFTADNIIVNNYDDSDTHEYPYSPLSLYGSLPNDRFVGMGTSETDCIRGHQSDYVNGSSIEYDFFNEEYSIVYADGTVKVLGSGNDGSKYDSTVIPKEVGEYKLRITIYKNRLHDKIKNYVTLSDGTNTDAEMIYKEIPYEIVPLNITPKAELDVYTNNNGVTFIRPSVNCEGVNWTDVFDTVFKVGDKVIEKDTDGHYSPYELTAEDTGLVTFSISLKNDKKDNYILSKDSVTEAIYNPNGTPLTPVASSDAKVVHTYDDDRYSVPVEEFSGTITLQGLPAGKNVSCKISDISLSGKGPGELTATVRLTLTGADAGEFVLANSTITVPATVNGINLSDQDVQVSLSSYGETFYPSSDGNDPFEPRVSVFAPSGRKLPDSCYKVTYLNNTLPSVLDRNGDGLLAKVIISGVEGGPAYGSVTEEFRIYLYGGDQASEFYTMEKGGKKELVISTFAPLVLLWDDHGAIDVKAESPVNGQAKVTIEALRSGEAILMAKGTNYYKQDFYYLYGITVTDKDAPAESIPSTVFARTSSDPIGMVRANRVSITAQAGTGLEESGLGVVRPVTVSGQIYPIDKDGYKFMLSAVPGYDQATGYKVVAGKTAGELELPTGNPKALDENVTNGRPGMSRTFTAATPEALKALTGTLVRLQWYNGSTPLGQPETYRLNFDGLQAKSDIGIEYVNVYSYDNDSADRKLGIDNDIIATANDASSKIIFKGKAPDADKVYQLYIRTTMGGSFWQDIMIKPSTADSPITYEFTKKYSGGSELTNDKQSFYILNKPYTADLTAVQALDYVAAPVTSGKVAADVRNMTEDQVKELNEVISGSSSVGLTAALAIDGKIESAPTATNEHKDALKKVVGADKYNEDAVKSVIQPYLDITVTGYETRNGQKILAVNIDAMCRTIVTTATDPTGDNAIKVEGETADGETANAIKVGTDQKVTVNTPVEISLKLPSDFITVSSNNKLKYVYVKHTKGPNEYYYYATIDSNGVATFTSTHGLSPFELQADFQPEASVQAPNAPSGTAPTYFETLKEAIEAAEDGDIIEINKPITSTSITANISADKQLTFKLATGVMAGDPLTINGVPVDLSSGTVDAVIKKDSGGNGGGSGNGSGGTGGGGGGGGSTTPSKTYEVKTTATANGKITVSPQSAAKDSIVTITATPDKGYEVASVTVTDASGKAVAATAAGNGKYTFTMPGSAVTVSAAFKKTDNDPPTPPVWKNPFSDVKESDWFIDAVKYVNQNDLMVGTGNKFSPRRNLTRAEFAQILYKKAGSPSVAWTAKFKDVKENDWFAGQIIWAANEGVLAGYGNGTARPRNYITREELVSLLWRYENEPAPTMTTLNFPDANKVSTYAKEAMLWAAENGILEGRANGTLDPRGSATRAEAAQMLMNYFSKKK